MSRACLSRGYRRVMAVTAFAVVIGVLLLSLSDDAEAKAVKVKRPAEAVVLTGEQLQALRGAAPDRVVGFRRQRGRATGKPRWKQIPVQIDERADVDLGAVYNGTRPGITINAYVGAGTLPGADPDPQFDGDDELALMAGDGGRLRAGRANRGRIAPVGVRRRSAVELKLKDPLRGSARSWIYLYLSKPGGPRVGAVKGHDVTYDFNLLSGSYPETYEFEDGPNPEQSIVQTPYYRLRFTDRWISDQLSVRAPGANRRDIIDRRKAQFAPGFCGRSTDTFSDAEGAFVANVSGPVRAIRSYVGANSGPMTQREHIFYERVEEVRTFLRVHAIPGVIDFWDYSPAATGMTYRTSEGFSATVDGAPEDGDGPAPVWEQLSGEQGTVTHVNRLETDAPGTTTTAYYLDQIAPSNGAEQQCTGDVAAFAASGTRINGPIANTDPGRGDHYDLTGLRTVFYDGPDSSGAGAASERAAWVGSPLKVRARALAGR